MTPVEVIQGAGPIVLGLPHTGTYIPADIGKLLNGQGRKLADTDWHIERVYDGLLPGATMVRATFHRYVIDANRGPDDASLYPGQHSTGLVPTTDFDGLPIWDRAIRPEEVMERRVQYHAAYHAALQAELDRVKARHGVAILYDCHSIRSCIPFLFDHVLPDFNIGTADGVSCATEIAQIAHEAVLSARNATAVLNGRFKGGWTTRHYGQPANGVHAIQMELAQSTYLTAESAPWSFDDTKAARLRPILAAILYQLAAIAPSLKVT